MEPQQFGLAPKSQKIMAFILYILNIIKKSFILASTVLSFYNLDSEFSSLIAFLPTCIEFFPTYLYLSYINVEKFNQK